MAKEVWAFVVNPVAGRGHAGRLAQQLASKLKDSGATVSVSVTAARGDAERLAREAAEAGATRVIACGGDGTIHEVVNGLMSVPGGAGNTALGIVSSGRCNDLAYALDIPTDPSGVAEALLHGILRPIDLGRIGDRYFTTVATLGFDSEVSQYVAEGRAPSFLRGAAAYVYATLVTLIRYRSPWVHLKGDFGEYEGSLLLAATGNTSRYGGRMKITPSAVIDDGLLDVCLVEAVSRREVVRMIPKVFSGKHLSHPAVSMKQTRRLEIESQEPLWLWADGEPIAQTAATIEVVHHALSVVMPQERGPGE